MVTPAHTPTHRGYNESLGYFTHENECVGEKLPTAVLLLHLACCCSTFLHSYWTAVDLACLPNASSHAGRLEGSDGIDISDSDPGYTWARSTRPGAEAPPSHRRAAAPKAPSNGSIPIVDMWDSTGPAYGQNNSLDCSQSNQTGCGQDEA